MPPTASLKTFKYKTLINETNREQNRSLNVTWLLIFCLISSPYMKTTNTINNKAFGTQGRPIQTKLSLYVILKIAQSVARWLEKNRTCEVSGHSHKAKRQWTGRDPKECGQIVLADITWDNAHIGGCLKTRLKWQCCKGSVDKISCKEDSTSRTSGDWNMSGVFGMLQAQGLVTNHLGLYFVHLIAIDYQPLCVT